MTKQLNSTLPPGYSLLNKLVQTKEYSLFRVKNEHEGGTFLLKFISDTDSDILRSRFKHEINIIKKIHSESVLRLISVDTDNKSFFATFENFAGSAIKGLNFDTMAFLKFAVRMADALDELHRQQVIHNSLHPDEILYDAARKEVKIINFQYASTLAFETAENKNFRREQNLAYISPEQTGRMNRNVDYRSDFYSLGIILYEILTGHPPFQTRDPLEMVHCHIARVAPAPEMVTPGIPQMISEIVMKLLSKNAEDRYQSSAGLKSDLEECITRWERKKSIDAFPIGRNDRFDTLTVPQKLYGRENEINQLNHLFKKISNDEPAFVTISGYSGIGKTTLVQEIYKPLTKSRGYFISGKFDQLNRNIPYLSLFDALTDLVKLILTEPEENLQQWKNLIQVRLGKNARIITEVIPEFKILAGSPQAVQELPPAESQNRFNYVLQEFISIFARREHPIVLFLDDVQWADRASLTFLEKFVSEKRQGSLLLICAYRDNIVDQHHPLYKVLENLRDKKLIDTEVKLSALGRDDVDYLLSDTLHLPLENIRGLSGLIFEKTQGNPFFIRQFLKTLVDKNLLRYESVKSEAEVRWTWDENEIKKLGITENVVQLLMDKLETLPVETQSVLQLAACIGNEFDLNTLGVILELTANRAAVSLWPALNLGLIIPESENYKYILNNDSESGYSAVDLNVSYGFLHDRVQQAAYEMIPEDKKAGIHYTIGKLLLKNTSDSEIESMVFDILHHLNKGINKIRHTDERIKIAGLNLLAGRKAKYSAAFEAAYDYFSTGVKLLQSEDINQQYRTVWALYHELSETEYIIGLFGEAEKHFEDILSFSKSDIEKAKVLSTKVKLYTHINKVEEAMQTGIKAAQLLNWPIAAQPGRGKVAFEFLKTRLKMAGKSIPELKRKPEMKNESAKTAVELFSQMTTAAYFSGPEMIGYLNLQMMQIVLKFGNPESAPFVYSQYALLEGAGAGAYKRAYQFGELALSLTQTHQSPYWRSKTYLTMGAIINHWRRPMAGNLLLLKEAYQSAAESGDLLYSIYANRFRVHTKISMGSNLQDLLADVNLYIDYANRTRNSIFDLVIYRRMIWALLGEDAKLQAENFDSEKFLGEIRDARDLSAEIQHYICSIKTNFFNENYDAAVNDALAAQPVLHGSFGQLLELEYRFFTAMAIAKRIQYNQTDKRSELKNVFKKQIAKISKWSENCPENFTQHLWLLEAEYARTFNSDIPENLYRKAIDSADKNEFPHIAAIACECAAEYHFSKEAYNTATAFLIDAMHHYEQWGAVKKISLIQARFAHLLQDFDKRYQTVFQGKSSGAESISSTLDLDTILRASQALSGEIRLKNLIETIMQIVLANAGAERGLLILEKEGKLYVQAEGSTADSGIAILDPLPVTEYSAIAHTVIRYVDRSHESVVIDNAQADNRFSNDSYLQSEKVRSILCMPVMNQQNLKGILYLENNLTTEAFTEERIELLKVLSNEMAISIENALLYDRLKSANIKLEEYSKSLEQKVNERTKDLQKRSDELAQTNHDLEAAMQSLKNTQDQLIQSEKMASLGELTAGIAHEIKNPLNFVNNFAESSVDLIAELKENLEKVKEQSDPDIEQEINDLLSDIEMNLNKISEHGKRADSIIHSMMLHARGSSGQKEAVNINDLLEESVNLVYHGMRAQNPNFNITISKSLDPGVGEVDLVAQDINRVFLNLINNACYAAFSDAQANSSKSPQLNIKTTQVDGQVEIKIRDNGSGIPDSVKEKIFNPFFTTKPAGKGTGLGLSISYDIINKKHGGTLSFTSREGEFTEFTILLPKVSV